MVNFAVDDVTFGPDKLANVVAAIETELETRTNTKVIRLLQVERVYGDIFRGVLIIDA